MLANSVSPPAGGTSRASSMLAIGGTSSPALAGWRHAALLALLAGGGQVGDAHGADGTQAARSGRRRPPFERSRRLRRPPLGALAPERAAYRPRGWLRPGAVPGRGRLARFGLETMLRRSLSAHLCTSPPGR